MSNRFSSTSRTPPPPPPPPTNPAAPTSGDSSSSARGRTPCCTKVGLKRGPWTPEEDQLLINYINREGVGRWRILPKKAGLLRCGKSCRLRWMNYLRPSVKRGDITGDEEDLILRLHRLLGNRWSLIAGRIPGRTDNEIKNYWNTHLSKKLIRQGVDPTTHKPLDPNHSSTRRKISVPLSQIHDASASKHSNHVPTTLQDQRKDTPNGKILTTPADMCWRHDHDGGGGDDGNGCLNQEEDMNYFNEDVLTSFLNSLMNEEAFRCPYNFIQQDQQNSSNINVAPDSEALMISTSPDFNFDTLIMDSACSTFGVIPINQE